MRTKEQFQIGDKVVVVSNEPDSLIVGEYTGEQNFGADKNTLPLIKSEKDGQVYIAMGIIIKYSESLFVTIEKMDYKERWNRFCNPHAVIS